MSRLPESAYRPEVSEQVYAILRQEAERALHVGSAVIADAVFDRPQERDKLEQLAAASRIPFTGYWLQAPMEVLVSRVAARQKDRPMRQRTLSACRQRAIVGRSIGSASMPHRSPPLSRPTFSSVRASAERHRCPRTP